MKTGPIILCTLAAAGLGAAYGFVTPDIEVGTKAPNFELGATDGKSVDLSAFKGKYVVLEWTNNGCPFVRKHYNSGNMQALQAWAKEQGVVWLSIVSSAPGKQGHVTAEQGAELVKEKKINSAHYLLDPEGKVGRAYGAKTTPHMFVINPKGTVIYNGAIDDKPSPRLEDVPTAKNYVRAALEESMAGKAVSIPATQPYGCGMKY